VGRVGTTITILQVGVERCGYSKDWGKAVGRTLYLLGKATGPLSNRPKAVDCSGLVHEKKRIQESAKKDGGLGKRGCTGLKGVGKIFGYRE